MKPNIKQEEAELRLAIRQAMAELAAALGLPHPSTANLKFGVGIGFSIEGVFVYEKKVSLLDIEEASRAIHRKIRSYFVPAPGVNTYELASNDDVKLRLSYFGTTLTYTFVLSRWPAGTDKDEARS